MNIFLLDEDKTLCAQAHLDKHVVKMITEYAQLLSTTVRLSGINEGYRVTHQNHPCAKWCRASLSNWLYLRDLTSELQTEYNYRYGKVHKSFVVAANLPLPRISDSGLTPFALAMPDEYKTQDAVQSYRNYYNGAKRHIATWKNRERPVWYENKP